jgi:hypothetical protein
MGRTRGRVPFRRDESGFKGGVGNEHHKQVVQHLKLESAASLRGHRGTRLARFLQILFWTG